MTIFNEIKNMMEQYCKNFRKETTLEDKITKELTIGKMIPDITCFDGWGVGEHEWDAIIKIEYPRLSKKSDSVQKIEDKINNIFKESKYLKIDENRDELCYSVTVILKGEC